MTWRVEHGDCIKVMAAMPEASVDAIVCDPPYGLEFMGKEWDRIGDVRQPGDANYQSPDNAAGRSKVRYALGASYGTPAQAARKMQDWHEGWAREALRVLKPGGHLLAFGGTRTEHRLTAGIEDAGFEVRDKLLWLYGSGFPKSLDVSKAIDKAAGAEREDLGPSPFANRGRTATNTVYGEPTQSDAERVTAPATPDAEQWQGWGTALKPAHEPVAVARKPLAGTVAGNVLAHGTGALNVDGCRIATDERWEGDERPYDGANGFGPADEDGWEGNWTKRSESHAAGRWPANVVLDPEAAAMLDEQTGELAAGNHPAVRNGRGDEKVYGSGWSGGTEGLRRPTEAGGASRFFYVAKADTAERNAGLGNVVSLWAPADAPDRNDHPTVKPIDLMRWLVRLVTPPGGTVLDPFTGSGTTGCAAVLEGFDFIGIEREPAYLAIARARIAHWSTGATEVAA